MPGPDHFTRGDLANKVMMNFAIRNEDLTGVIQRILKRHKKLVRPTAIELGISHQTLFNWCVGLGIKTLSRRSAVKKSRDFLSKQQNEFWLDYGQVGWSFKKTIDMVLRKGCAGDISVFSMITGYKIQVIRAWCVKNKIECFDSTKHVNNHSHLALRKNIEQKFAGLGSDWGEITGKVMWLNNNNIQKAARHLGIQHVTMVRWATRWNVHFETQKRSKYAPRPQFRVAA